MDDNSDNENPFKKPLTNAEKEQLRYLIRTLITILIFVFIAAIVANVVSHQIF